MDEFGAELACLMGQRGMGVRELARRSGYSYGFISQLRGGTRLPSPETAQDLDDALDAGGSLSRAAAAAAHGRQHSAGANGDLALIELGRRARASDVGAGTVELLAVATDRLCRDYPVTEPGSCRTGPAHTCGT